MDALVWRFFQIWVSSMMSLHGLTMSFGAIIQITLFPVAREYWFIHQSGQLVVLSNQVFEKSAPFLRATHIGKETYDANYGTPPRLWLVFHRRPQ